MATATQTSTQYGQPAQPGLWQAWTPASYTATYSGDYYMPSGLPSIRSPSM